MNEIPPYRFPHIPNEIIAQITALLRKNDIHNARLACRYLHRVFKAAFASLHWGSAETNLSLESVQKLEKVALDEDYRVAVRRIKVRPFPRFHPLGYGHSWERDENKVLVMNSDPVKRIQRLLGQNFPNCRTLHLVGVKPNSRASAETLSFDELADVFFSSITLCSIPLERVLVDYRLNKITGPWLRSSLGLLNDDQSPNPWTNAEFLRLQGNIGVSGAAETAAALIAKGTGIKKLSIVDRNRRELKVSLLFSSLLSSSQLPALTHLCLTLMTLVTDTQLCALLLRFKDTLQHVQFYEEPHVIGSWKLVFSTLGGHFPKLKSFTMVDGWEYPSARRRSPAKPVFFCPLRTAVPELETEDFEFVENYYGERHYRVSGVRYRGSRIEAALLLLERSMYTEPATLDFPEYVPDVPGRQPITKFTPWEGDLYRIYM